MRDPRGWTEYRSAVVASDISDAWRSVAFRWASDPEMMPTLDELLDKQWVGPDREPIIAEPPVDLVIDDGKVAVHISETIYVEIVPVAEDPMRGLITWLVTPMRAHESEFIPSVGTAHVEVR